MLIGFENLRLSCIIGVYPEERLVEQNLFVDLRVTIQPIKEDRIEDTLDYVVLAELCGAVAKQNHQLIESFAKEVLNQILKIDNVEKAWIRVKKPNALLHAQHTFVEMEGSRCER